MRRAVRARSPMQAYRNRDYVQHLLDERVFEAMNTGLDPTPLLCTTGCLDALDYLPAGGTEGWGANNRWFDQIEYIRGTTIDELREINYMVEKLFADLTSSTDEPGALSSPSS